MNSIYFLNKMSFINKMNHKTYISIFIMHLYMKNKIDYEV
jgi:hypothetical protein